MTRGENWADFPVIFATEKVCPILPLEEMQVMQASHPLEEEDVRKARAGFT